MKMFLLHRISFDQLLANIFWTLDIYDSKFAFPTVAAVAAMKPELVKKIDKEGHEVASHGYAHVRYPHITPKERKIDVAQSIQIFKKLNIDVKGFRAPYDNYTDDLPTLLNKFGFLWDGGFGFRSEYRSRTQFFSMPINGKESEVTFIPLNEWSDDRMIDTFGMTPQQITVKLKQEIRKAAKSKGVIMFDLHPIRIGQRKYLSCLQEVVEYAHTLGAWCPTPSEAVSYWKKHQKWKGDAQFCLLLTGDIDNWEFSDYLRRQIWRQYLRRVN